jgi:hypothetical protein
MYVVCMYACSIYHNYYDDSNLSGGGYRGTMVRISGELTVE